MSAVGGLAPITTTAAETSSRGVGAPPAARSGAGGSTGPNAFQRALGTEGWLAVGVMLVVALLVVPLPPMLLDGLLALSIAWSRQTEWPEAGWAARYALATSPFVIATVFGAVLFGGRAGQVFVGVLAIVSLVAIGFLFWLLEIHEATPGSIAGTWQRFGRAGRRGETSIAVLCANSTAIELVITPAPERFAGSRYPTLRDTMLSQRSAWLAGVASGTGFGIVVLFFAFLVSLAFG